MHSTLRAGCAAASDQQRGAERPHTACETQSKDRQSAPDQGQPGGRADLGEGSEPHDPEETVEMLCEELLAVLATIGRSKGNWRGRGKPHCRGMRLATRLL